MGLMGERTGAVDIERGLYSRRPLELPDDTIPTKDLLEEAVSLVTVGFWKELPDLHRANVRSSLGKDTGSRVYTVSAHLHNPSEEDIPRYASASAWIGSSYAS